ncbi:MAG: hypothetical protein R3E10_04785 [Gemmatimonadota bacterium]
MTNGSEKTLLDLQRIDAEIQKADHRRLEFEPQLEAVGETAARLETEVEQARGRLNELKLDERRLENAARDKKARLDKLQDRLNSVRNLREEAAVHAEADLVRRAMEADEHEALSLLDLIRRAEERIEDLEAELDTARTELAPRREELLAGQQAVQTEIDALAERREAIAAQVPPAERAYYERVQDKGRRVVVAALTEDGACGHCYAVIPLQLQNEIRRGGVLIRCESCGVVLAVAAEVAPEDSVPSEA